jgi:lysophospholipase L1-like esterase
MNQPMPRVAMVAAMVVILTTIVLAPVSVSDCAWAQEAAPADRGAMMRQRGRELLARLQRGEPVRLVAFGDSLTAGWGTDGRHVYCRIVADTLQYAFPRSRIESITHGHPGETTAGALRRLDDEVKATKPDLLLVQFGGNDKGWGRSVDGFREDLGKLLRRSADETEALVIACLPPIVDPDPANEWNETARSVAAQEAVPAADLDMAIRQGDGDYRGPFPYGSHPDGFTHLIMAREVLRALREAVGLTPAFTCQLVKGSRLSGQSVYDLEVEVKSVSDTPLECTVQVEWENRPLEEKVRLTPHQTARLQWKLLLQPFTGQSRAHPVRLLARGGGVGESDVAWLTVAPAVRADGGTASPDAAVATTWHDLPDEALVMGRHRWLGASDLSARFAAMALPDRLRFTIEVTDNDITTASPDDPSQGDSVELYVDLRSDADQGKPIYSRSLAQKASAIALQITPPSADEAAHWRGMQDLPEQLDDLAVTCVRTGSGYRAQVDLSMTAVTALRGAAWPGLGFDVGVNDADFGGIRKSQMMWTGYPDNYLNPGYLGGLYLDKLPPNAMRQTLR